MTARLLNAIVIAFVISVLVPFVVFAHAHLEESDPADGETITTPYTLTARFSDEFDVVRSFIRVIDAGGTVVAEGGVSEDDPTAMVVELPELVPGDYEVRWQTVTPDDSGVERNTFTFTVGAAASPGLSPQAIPSPSAATATTAASGASVPPSPSVPSTTAPPPTASPAPIDGSPSASGTDLMLALVLAAVAVGAVLLFILARIRR